MRLLIVGSLSGELGRAASIAVARGASIDQADQIIAAMEKLRRDASFDLVFCEVRFEIAALMKMLELERIRAEVIACGYESDPDVAAAAMRAGAHEFLPLPPDADLIAALLEKAVGVDPSLVANDPGMLALIRRAEQVAASNASILISGESGTGKECLARHIHRKSRRAKGPFVAINCAAIPDNLLESELFGHEKGAFSGAIARRLGKFEAASGGTLLLDEVSEMDVRLQAKLLRALQEREIDRVGGASPVKVDVRVLATSNRMMQAEVDAGRFRADLYFRLNVVTLTVPPLRQRRGDIAVLARHYAGHYAKVNGVPDRALSATTVAMLEAHSWPGNVRELENAMHRAVLLSSGPELDETYAEQLGQAKSGEPSPQPVVNQLRNFGGGDRSVSGLVGRSMEDVERALIIETLGHTSGNRTRAALILGISIRALRNKLRDYTGLGFDIPVPSSGTSA